MKVVLVADAAGSPPVATVADAVRRGWTSVRPDDDVVARILSDGGPGLLDAVGDATHERRDVEVAGPEGHPVLAPLLLRRDGTAVVEAARVCGPDLVPSRHQTPRLATSYGVGQLLDGARVAGARRVVVGVRGSAAVDGGAGAVSGLSFRLTVADGSGLKIGGDDLGRVAAAARGWAADWRDVEVVVLTDGITSLDAAAVSSRPWSGATADDVAGLTGALTTWADVAERDLPGAADRAALGSGDGGGLGFGLVAALPAARLAAGPALVAELVGLDAAIDGADLVVTTAAPGSPVRTHLEAALAVPVVALVGDDADALGAAAARRATRSA